MAGAALPRPPHPGPIVLPGWSVLPLARGSVLSALDTLCEHSMVIQDADTAIALMVHSALLVTADNNAGTFRDEACHVIPCRIHGKRGHNPFAGRVRATPA